MYKKLFTLLLISKCLSIEAMSDFTISTKDVSFRGQAQRGDDLFENIKKIVEAKQDINAFIMQDESGDSLLTYAIKLYRTDIVSYLLKNGSNVNFVNKERKTPLMLAAEQSSSEIAGMLLNNGAYAGIDAAIHRAMGEYYPGDFGGYIHRSDREKETYRILSQGKDEALKNHYRDYVKFHLDIELNKDVSDIVLSYLE